MFQTGHFVLQLFLTVGVLLLLLLLIGLGLDLELVEARVQPPDDVDEFLPRRRIDVDASRHNEMRFSAARDFTRAKKETRRWLSFGALVSREGSRYDD
jgi:hypothetical protein